MVLLTSAALLASDASAFSPPLQRSLSNRLWIASSPHNSLSQLGATPTREKGSSVWNLLAQEIGEKKPNHGPHEEGEGENHNTDDEWTLLIYNDKGNSREKVARVLVQVTGRSESEAFRTIMEAHNTGLATVDTRLQFEIAEAYHEGLRKEGIVSEIVPLGGRGDYGEWE